MAIGSIAVLLTLTPARWLAAGLAGLSDQRILLTQVQGTVWRGSAHLQLRAGPGSRDVAQLPGRVRWHMGLGLQQLQIGLLADCCTTQPLVVQLQPGWNTQRVQLQVPSSRWPAEILRGLGTPWNTVQLQGQLILSSTGLSLSMARNGVLSVQGQLQLDAVDLSSRLSTLHPLGTYRLQLHGVEGRPRLELSTVQGQLRLSGEGDWAAQRLRFRGEAEAASGLIGELDNLLNIIGRRDGARSIIQLG